MKTVIILLLFAFPTKQPANIVKLSDFRYFTDVDNWGKYSDEVRKKIREIL
jgi:hypothetical protein